MTKDEAFEKWNTPHWVNEDGKKVDMSFAEKAFNAGWQAAKQQSSSETAELKERLNEVAADWQVKHYQIEELKADNELLREAALNLVTIMIEASPKVDIVEQGCALDRLMKVLYDTPAQSMKGE